MPRMPLIPSTDLQFMECYSSMAQMLTFPIGVMHHSFYRAAQR